MAGMVAHLKEQSLALNDRLRADNASLDVTSGLLLANKASTSVANETLAAENAAARWSLCETLGLLILGAVLWAMAYAAIRWLPPQLGLRGLLLWWLPW